MAPFKLLIFTLTFYELTVDLDALTCPKGHRVNLDRSGCEICPDGYYQTKDNDSQRCRPCTQCEINRGSAVEQKCTKEMDTKCKCRGDFVPWESDCSTCKCGIGFGLTNGECSKCADGYFSIQINSPCQKWKECKSGVNITGTRTSDVICNELKSHPDITTPYITLLTSHQPHEETQSQKIHTTATTAPQRHTVTTEQEGKIERPSSSSTGNNIGMVLLMFGIVGLLVLTAVTCKLHIRPCVQRKPAVQTKDSLCRRPVEESGDGSLSSLKLNPGEP
ncbi:tumor necrosis factor receptor superfamily member 4 isoform X2 [Xiphias gladius]|uniref:tumor necrosis factor receptor superfamily member 4 isoform X2 n=1 Tax=Xiphias gladius TaxID=8245 RepID=UPI001A999BB8|nr:tumor necrosis factor receptor superfamily member 4 isoform X2 [Xiphias gladius]